MNIFITKTLIYYYLIIYIYAGVAEWLKAPESLDPHINEIHRNRGLGVVKLLSLYAEAILEGGAILESSLATRADIW